MKDFFLPLALFLVLAFLLQVFIPWWILAILGFALGFLKTKKPSQAFSVGFTGGFILWFSTFVYLDQASQSILSPKIAVLLGIPSPLLIFSISALIIAIYCGFAFLTGFYFQQVIKKK